MHNKEKLQTPNLIPPAHFSSCIRQTVSSTIVARKLSKAPLAPADLHKAGRGTIPVLWCTCRCKEGRRVKLAYFLSTASYMLTSAETAAPVTIPLHPP